MLYLIFVGKSEEPFIDVERYYSERVKSSGIIKISEVKELKKMRGKVYITSPGGREINEQELIDLVKRAYLNDLSLLVGGPFGVPDDIEGEKISFSKLTFSHGLFRVMLLEQVYRALLTIKGSDYRK